MEKVIITGVTGFIGSNLALNFLKRGVTVYGVDMQNANFGKFDKYGNFHKIIADFSQYETLYKLLPDQTDCFYHLAWAGGFTSAIKDYKLQLENAVYAATAIENACKAGCKKFVYAGTYNEYETLTFLSSSHFVPRYTCIYSAAKTAGDMICRTVAYKNGIHYSSALIPMPYGEGNYSKQLANIAINYISRKIAPKFVEGNNLYDMVYIDDIVAALIDIAEKGCNQAAYYVGHRNLKTFKELMSSIRDILSPELELKFGEYKEEQNIDYSFINLDKLYYDTGFECKADFEETIKKTAKWIEQNLYID